MNRIQDISGQIRGYKRPLKTSVSAMEPTLIAQPALSLSSGTLLKDTVSLNLMPGHLHNTRRSYFPKKFSFVHLHRSVAYLKHYKVGSTAIAGFIIGIFIIIVGGNYWSSRISAQFKPIAIVKPSMHTIAGLSIAIPHIQLAQELEKITSQQANLTVGSQTIAISPNTIRSWLIITPSTNNVQDYIQVNTKAMESSLLSLANQYVTAPVNQVSVTHTDGITPSGVILAGKNGTSLGDPGGLSAQAEQSASNLMNAKGLSFNTPLNTVPFQSLTPANFPKLLEEDVTTNRLYAWQNGQLVNTFLTSDGKPSTPTPTGEFHIWTKLTSQTMIGPGYVQPNVPWVNYFDYSGDAIHGNYWRPASVFGVTGTSHGCIGVEVSQAEWIYNWAPIGTTVINHT